MTPSRIWSSMVLSHPSLPSCTSSMVSFHPMASLSKTLSVLWMECPACGNSWTWSDGRIDSCILAPQSTWKKRSRWSWSFSESFSGSKGRYKYAQRNVPLGYRPELLIKFSHCISCGKKDLDYALIQLLTQCMMKFNTPMPIFRCSPLFILQLTS